MCNGVSNRPDPIGNLQESPGPLISDSPLKVSKQSPRSFQPRLRVQKSRKESKSQERFTFANGETFGGRLGLELLSMGRLRLKHFNVSHRAPSARTLKCEEILARYKGASKRMRCPPRRQVWEMLCCLKFS